MKDFHERGATPAGASVLEIYYIKKIG